jgi:hypothetical protein
MVQEFIDKYGNLGDATVHSVSYARSAGDNGLVTIVLSAFNQLNDFKFEKIILRLTGIKKFRFIEIDGCTNFVIFAAFILEENNEVILDFFPIMSSNGGIVNTESDFIVKCLDLTFETL